MANFVNLLLDKDTGKFHAGGTGGSSTPPTHHNVYGHVHVQSVTSQSWDIQHDCDSVYLQTQIFTDTGYQIYPDDVQIVDSNNILITFGAPQAGSATVLCFNVTP